MYFWNAILFDLKVKETNSLAGRPSACFWCLFFSLRQIIKSMTKFIMHADYFLFYDFLLFFILKVEWEKNCSSICIGFAYVLRLECVIFIATMCIYVTHGYCCLIYYVHICYTRVYCCLAGLFIDNVHFIR